MPKNSKSIEHNEWWPTDFNHFHLQILPNMWLLMVQIDVKHVSTVLCLIERKIHVQLTPIPIQILPTVLFSAII